jgi:hypothetical protein
MAQHWTNAQIQTALAKTAQNLKPYEVKALADALKRTPHAEDADWQNGANELTLGVIFPGGGLNP